MRQAACKERHAKRQGDKRCKNDECDDSLRHELVWHRQSNASERKGFRNDDVAKSHDAKGNCDGGEYGFLHNALISRPKTSCSSLVRLREVASGAKHLAIVWGRMPTLRPRLDVVCVHLVNIDTIVAITDAHATIMARRFAILKL